MKTIKEFDAASSIDTSLIRAVIRQAGGWDSFKGMAEDITNHGAAGGFHGFIYYVDTVKFYKRNRDAIMDYARDMASDLGMNVLDMIGGFNCLRDSATSEEVGGTVYGRGAEIDTQVANALSWFALEEVARSYADNC